MTFPSTDLTDDLFDAHGFLIPGRLASPPTENAYTVFAQRQDARIEMRRWRYYARGFFAADLALTTPKRYRTFGWIPQVDAARVRVAPAGLPAAERLVYGRKGLKPDYNAAEAADRRKGFPGFDFLARECGYVWLVAREADPDPHALLLSAAIACVVLGPIVAPGAKAIFGVSGARARLEKLGVSLSPVTR